MEFAFDKELYSKEAIFKASYRYIDDFYIHLSTNDTHYIVSITKKNGPETIDEREFLNEMLLQQTRVLVTDKTFRLREMMYARAMASTIIEDAVDTPEEEEFEIDNILVDWFDEGK